MHNPLLYFIAAILFFMISCQNMNSASSKDLAASVNDHATDTGEMQIPEYYDLQTNRPVDVLKDTNSHQYVDLSTHKPLVYYYEAISHDTFDIRGRIINNALILKDGKYSIDETKIKSDMDAFKARANGMKKGTNIGKE